MGSPGDEAVVVSLRLLRHDGSVLVARDVETPRDLRTGPTDNRNRGPWFPPSGSLTLRGSESPVAPSPRRPGP